MNSYERIKRMYEHREADRVPMIDDPWKGTLRRWRAEGMPAGSDHSIPNSVSLENMKRIMEEIKRVGRY